MEIQNLKEDIKVFYIKAKSFPDGVKEAHEKLHSLTRGSEPRRFFGISYGSNYNEIIYKAAAEELYDGESEYLGCETFIIRKGEYISETLTDWMKDESKVGETFRKLLSDSRIDRNGYCLEIYLNSRDMQCMVKLDPAKIKK